jgi:hypothetical protein
VAAEEAAQASAGSEYAQITYFQIQTMRALSEDLSIFGRTAFGMPVQGINLKINLAWLSRKSIIFSTISMESFDDSPDADRHGGNSIPR